MESKILHMLGKCSTTELCSWALVKCFLSLTLTRGGPDWGMKQDSEFKEPVLCIDSSTQKNSFLKADEIAQQLKMLACKA